MGRYRSCRRERAGHGSRRTDPQLGRDRQPGVLPRDVRDVLRRVAPRPRTAVALPPGQYSPARWKRGARRPARSGARSPERHVLVRCCPLGPASRTGRLGRVDRGAQEPPLRLPLPGLASSPCRIGRRAGGIESADCAIRGLRCPLPACTPQQGRRHDPSRRHRAGAVGAPRSARPARLALTRSLRPHRARGRHRPPELRARRDANAEPSFPRDTCTASAVFLRAHVLLATGTAHDVPALAAGPDRIRRPHGVDRPRRHGRRVPRSSRSTPQDRRLRPRTLPGQRRARHRARLVHVSGSCAGGGPPGLPPSRLRRGRGRDGAGSLDARAGARSRRRARAVVHAVGGRVRSPDRRPARYGDVLEQRPGRQPGLLDLSL